METHWISRTLEGWGRCPRSEAMVARPERISEIKQALKDRQGRPILAYGMGRSYGDAALIEGGRVVLTERLNRMLDFDPNTGWLRVESGVSLKEIIDTFLPRGFFPPVVPGTQFVTVGGAIGCDIHGKNHHVAGTFADHVRRLELLLATGEIVICDKDTEPELFWATVGGMGLTGVILALDLKLDRVHNAAIRMDSIRVNHLDEFFAVGEKSKQFTHTMGWIDCVKRGDGMGRGIFMRGEHAPAGTEVNESALDVVSQWMNGWLTGRPFESNFLLNPLTVRMFNEAFFRKTPAGLTTADVHVTPFFFPLDAVSRWNYIYGARGLVQYQLVVPSRDAVKEILKVVSDSGFASFLAVIKEFGEREHSGLSFPAPGTTLALDFPNVGEPLFTMLDRLDDMVIEDGGRVYLGKDCRLSREKFRRMYPGWEAWKHVRDTYDPGHVFQSDLGIRLGLVAT